MIDSRYRQVLPVNAPQVILRPAAHADPSRYTAAPSVVAATAAAAPNTTTPLCPHKDEREAPEGASSSPGLINDVNM